jgi:aminoglycoside phosphotransferase (APT) family kinase protein
MSIGTPAQEAHVDAHVVRSLLSDQHPDLADLSIRTLDTGWDNFMFRVGDRLVARLPRRDVAAQLLVNEQEWLPVVARDLPLPAPIPLRHGAPGRGYPWRWSILPWLEGTPANLAPPDASEAVILATFLKALHRPAPDNAPVNSVRGVPLSSRAPSIEPRLARLREKTSCITQQVEAAWRHGLAAESANCTAWLHGDLHPRNVLVRDGKLSGVIDWGDITSGDRATDLACIWMLFADPSAREAALTCYGASELERVRAMGWAVLFGAVLLDTGLVDNKHHASIGDVTLARVTADS